MIKHLLIIYARNCVQYPAPNKTKPKFKKRVEIEPLLLLPLHLPFLLLLLILDLKTEVPKSHPNIPYKPIKTLTIITLRLPNQI